VVGAPWWGAQWWLLEPDFLGRCAVGQRLDEGLGGRFAGRLFCLLRRVPIDADVAVLFVPPQIRGLGNGVGLELGNRHAGFVDGVGVAAVPLRGQPLHENRDGVVGCVALGDSGSHSSNTPRMAPRHSGGGGGGTRAGGRGRWGRGPGAIAVPHNSNI